MMRPHLSSMLLSQLKKIFVFFFIATPCLAVEYQIDRDRLFNPSRSDFSFFSSALDELSLSAVFASSILQTNQSVVDFFFMSPNGEKTIAVKGGLYLQDRLYPDLVWNEQLEIFILHFQTNSTGYVAILKNFSKNEATSISKLLTPQKQKTVLFTLLFSEIHAHSCSPTTLQTATLANVSASIEEQSIVSTIGKCTSNLLRGAGNSAASSVQFFKQLVTNPLSLWNEMVSTMQALKGVIVNLKTEIQTLFQTLRNLDLEFKSELICYAVGDLAAQIAIGSLSAATLAKTLATSIVRLKSFITTIQKIVDLKKFGLNKNGQLMVMREALACY